MIKTPVCLLTADSKPLNEQILKRIMSVTVTDNRANEADQLDITLDDSDGVLELPRRGVKINCQLGFVGEGMHDKGDFIVDETEWSGSPDIITIKASSANFKSKIKEAKSKSYHRKTFGEVATEIAKNHELTLVMTDDLKKIDLQHIDQTNESDLNLLVRISKQNGAEMALKWRLKKIVYLFLKLVPQKLLLVKIYHLSPLPITMATNSAIQSKTATQTIRGYLQATMTLVKPNVKR